MLEGLFFANGAVGNGSFLILSGLLVAGAEFLGTFPSKYMEKG
jgi:hypothetical protein